MKGSQDEISSGSDWLQDSDIETCMCPANIWVQPSRTFPGPHVYAAVLTFNDSVRSMYTINRVYAMKTHVPADIHESQFVFTQCWSGLDAANHFPDLPDHQSGGPSCGPCAPESGLRSFRSG